MWKHLPHCPTAVSWLAWDRSLRRNNRITASVIKKKQKKLHFCLWSLLLPPTSCRIDTSTESSTQQTEAVLWRAAIWGEFFLKYPKIEAGEQEQFYLPLQCQFVCHGCKEKEHLAASGIWGLQHLVEYF